MSLVRAESTFAYHGLDTGESTDTEVVKSLIRSFLDKVKFYRSTPLIKDPELESAVWIYFKSQNLGQKTEKAVHGVLKLSITLTLQAYTSLPFENKVLCAIQFLYMFLVDDIAPSFLEELRFFCQNMQLDVFGDPKITGKVGTDIRDNKCSWIALAAFELCSSEQKVVLSLCYGRPDLGKEARVKDDFRQVDIEGVFRHFEVAELDNLEKQIDQLAGEHGPLKDVLWSVLEKILRRDK